MEIKPRVFIGSSSEGLKVARLLKDKLSSWAECDIWDEDIFEINKSNLENLYELINLYEYGVIVATGDDTLESRGEKQLTARDNIIFELGLFMGRLGLGRSFFVFQEGIRVLSDMNGITIHKFPNVEGSELDAALEKCGKAIKKYIDKNSNIFQGGIFPSVPLAFGYFNNFIAVVCKRLVIDKFASVDNKKIKVSDFELNILIPNDLMDDMKNKVAATKNLDKLRNVSVRESETRSYSFYVSATTNSEGKMILKDVPTTLMSLHQTINEFLNIKQIGHVEKEKIVEQREIRRFKEVLDHLISRNSFTKDRVKTEIVSI